MIPDVPFWAEVLFRAMTLVGSSVLASLGVWAAWEFCKRRP